MDLSSRLDKILQVCPVYVQLELRERDGSLPGEEVSEVDEFAMSLILHIDDSPSILPSSYGLAVNDDTSFRANNGERKHFLTISYMDQDEKDL
jgi:hypothetical protein